MTFGGWALYAVAVLFIAAVGAFIVVCTDSGIGKSRVIIVCAVVAALALAAMLWYYNNTADGLRRMKSQKSNLNHGIERVVRVYDVGGDLLERYEGRFDIDCDENRLIFDDEHDKRHVIYYKTGTVIVDEK